MPAGVRGRFTGGPIRLPFSLALLLLAAGAGAQSLDLPSDLGGIAVTASVAGSDLSVVAEFEQPPKAQLNDDNPVLSLDLYLDTDNNAKTGFDLVDDARRGADYSLTMILRAPGFGGPGAKQEEVLLVKEGGKTGKVVETNVRMTVDGARIQVLAPLAALGLRKGQTIRLAGFCGPNDPLDRTIILQPIEAESRPR